MSTAPTSDTAEADEKPAPPKPPFFIVANDRSGTTMLRLILDRDPTVAIPTESMILSDFAAVRSRGSLGDRQRAQAFADRVWRHPKVRLWQLDGGSPRIPNGLTSDEAYRYSVEAPYKAYAAQHGARRFADKTPPYVFIIDELLAVWPDAKIINVVRDGRDVALSVMGLPFGANNAWAAARDWAEGIRAGLKAEVDHPEHVMTVRYEDLVQHPREQVERICRFVDIPFDMQLLNIEDTDEAKLVADQAEWFEKVWEGISTSSVGKWVNGMQLDDQRIFEAVAGEELTALGYATPLADSDELQPIGRVRAARWWLANKASRLGNFVRLRIVQERGRELRYVIARRLRR